MPENVKSQTAPAGPLQDALERLLDAIQPPEDCLPKVQAIKAQLVTATDTDRLKNVLRDITGLIIQARRRREEDRRELEKFLQQLSDRFHDLKRSLQGTEQQTSVAYQGTRKAEVALERQIQEIESRTRMASSMDQIKQSVYQRARIIRARLDDSRGKEASQYAALQAHLNALTVAIRDMQHKSETLQARFEQEKTKTLRDPLTGVANRFAYEQRMRQEFSRWKRYGSPLVLQIWRLDNIAEISRNHGKTVSEKALQALAKVMEANLRETDFIARYENETFTVLLPESTIETSRLVADRIRNSLSTSLFHKGKTEIAIVVSCGYAALQEGDTIESVFHRAGSSLNEIPFDS